MLLLLTVCAICGCGQIGPLYLPQDASEPTPELADEKTTQSTEQPSEAERD